MARLREGARDRRGFGIIELPLAAAGLTLWVLVVAAAVAIPNLMHSRQQANETHAIAALKAYATAQSIFMMGGSGIRAAEGEFCRETIPGAPPPNADAYSREVKMYAYPYPDLYRLSMARANPDAPIALISRPFAGACHPGGAWNGYWFTSIRMDRPNPNGFDLCATPAVHGNAGRNTYFIDQTGAVRQRDFGATVGADGRRLKEEGPDNPGIDWIET